MKKNARSMEKTIEITEIIWYLYKNVNRWQNQKVTLHLRICQDVTPRASSRRIWSADYLDIHRRCGTRTIGQAGHSALLLLLRIRNDEELIFSGLQSSSHLIEKSQATKLSGAWSANELWQQKTPFLPFLYRMNRSRRGYFFLGGSARRHARKCWSFLLQIQAFHPRSIHRRWRTASLRSLWTYRSGNPSGHINRPVSAA